MFQNSFIEVTVVTDSENNLCLSRKSLIRIDKITSINDVSEAKYFNNANTIININEPRDYVDEESGCVVRSERYISVQENYKTIIERLDKLKNKTSSS